MSDAVVETYVCTDIETDGPSPGQYSMLSFASVAFRLDKTILGTFERNLELLPGAKQDAKTMRFWETQPEAWKVCRANIVSPKVAIGEYRDWLKSLPGTPVCVAHPVGFDFTFIHWYLHEFVGENPFFPAGLDVASYAMAVLDQPFTRSHRPYLPKEWIEANVPHSHKAIDDAMGHALMFCNIVAGNRKMRAAIEKM
jgi:DNA polymerase III alpha subunit (gram-positive type)